MKASASPRYLLSRRFIVRGSFRSEERTGTRSQPCRGERSKAPPCRELPRPSPQRGPSRRPPRRGVREAEAGRPPNKAGNNLPPPPPPPPRCLRASLFQCRSLWSGWRRCWAAPSASGSRSTARCAAQPALASSIARPDLFPFQPAPAPPRPLHRRSSPSSRRSRRPTCECASRCLPGGREGPPNAPAGRDAAPVCLPTMCCGPHLGCEAREACGPA